MQVKRAVLQMLVRVLALVAVAVVVVEWVLVLVLVLVWTALPRGGPWFAKVPTRRRLHHNTTIPVASVLFVHGCGQTAGELHKSGSFCCQVFVRSSTAPCACAPRTSRVGSPSLGAAIEFVASAWRSTSLRRCLKRA